MTSKYSVFEAKEDLGRPAFGVAETEEAAAYAVFGSAWREYCGGKGLGRLVSFSAVARASGGGRRRNEGRASD